MSPALDVSKDVAQASGGDTDNVAARISQNSHTLGRAPLVARQPSIKFLGPLPEIPGKAIERSDLVFPAIRVEDKGFLSAGRYRKACFVEKLDLTNWRRVINLGRGSDTPRVDQEAEPLSETSQKSHADVLERGPCHACQIKS
jgi:hypothetical protein